jgi:hypothetical protein
MPPQMHEFRATQVPLPAQQRGAAWREAGLRLVRGSESLAAALLRPYGGGAACDCGGSLLLVVRGESEISEGKQVPEWLLLARSEVRRSRHRSTPASLPSS